MRPTNLFVNDDNHLILGPIKKCETESLRSIRHLISKYNITKFVKLYFVYWAPEVLNGQEITIKSDIWSVGVIIFILLTGELPFDIKKEESIIANIKSANINWRPMIDHPKMLNLLKSILVVNPADRWDINNILRYCQDDFIIIIQRNYRGYRGRRKIKAIMSSLRKIQATAKGWLVRKLYQRRRFEVRWQAARLIQKKFREFRKMKKIRSIKKLMMILQANVLARQMRRAYLKLRKDIITAQA